MLSKRFFKTKDETEVTFEFKHPDAVSCRIYRLATSANEIQ